MYAPRELPLHSIPGGRCIYQLAAAEHEGTRYAVVALGMANPFLVDNLSSLLLHWGCSEGEHSGWMQPPKGWHTSPGVSTVRQAGRQAGMRTLGRGYTGWVWVLQWVWHALRCGMVAEKCWPTAALGPANACKRVLPVLPWALPLHATCCLPPTCVQPTGSLAWETVFGAYAPVMQGEQVVEAASYSVVLQIPLEGTAGGELAHAGAGGSS